MTRRVVRALLVGSVAAGLPVHAVASPASPPEPPPDPLAVDVDGAAFAETFDEPESLDRFDWFVHNAANFFERPDQWHGDHDEMCGPPTSARTVHFPDAGVGTHLSADRGELAYWCAPGGAETGHLMTTFNTAGYGQVDFAPHRIFTDVSEVCWDQNQTNLGNRKWTQVVVVPEETFQSNDERLDYVVPHLQDGPGAKALRLTEGVFLFEMVQGSTRIHVGQTPTALDFHGDATIADKAQRFTTCLTDLEDGTTRVLLERQGGEVEERILMGSMPDGPARVIFQDDNYNPPKAESPASVPDPFSWHWDNVVVRAASADAPPDATASEPTGNGAMPQAVKRVIGAVWIVAAVAAVLS